MNPKPSYQYESSDLGFIRIDSDWKFGLDQSELGLKTWFRIGSDNGKKSFQPNPI